jgi:hypothetical protein
VNKEDLDDNKVLGCAKAAKAEVIVSGDSHLLDLKQYVEIEILMVNQLLDKLKQPVLVRIRFLANLEQRLKPSASHRSCHP